MKSIRIDIDKTATECVDEAVKVLRAQGVVLFPTDTLFALGGDAFSDAAVAKVRSIKEISGDKPMHALVADLEMAALFCEVSSTVRALAEKFPKGKITFVCKKKPGLVSGIGRGIESFGFRIPDNDLCVELLRAFGAPITATSANKTGATPPRDIAGILEQLGSAAESGIDLVIFTRKMEPTPPSTVVDLTGEECTVLREGAIPAEEILRIVGMIGT